MDLGAPQVPTGRWGNDFALERPGRQLYVGWHEPEEVLLPLSSLNGDMDVAMTIGKVRSWTTVTTWQVRAFNLNEHAAHRRT